MRRKISMILCALALVMGLSGCVSKESVYYDPAELENACEQVLYIIQSEAVSDDYINALSDWNQGYLMANFEAQTGVQMEAEDLVTALEGWAASYEECGEYLSHGEYTFKSTSTGVTATTEAEFSERNASLEFSFDEDLHLEAFTVGAHFSMGEILKKAGLNTLLGMGTVFVVLVFMSFIISLIKYVPAILDRSAKNTAPEKVQSEAPAAAVSEAVPETDDLELIAVIAAAIAAAEGTTPDGFVVRSIKRRSSNKWNA